MLKNTIKALTAIGLSVACYILTVLLGSIIFLKTNVGEGSLPLVTVISTALLAILMSYLFSRFYSIKKIICVIITFCIIFIIKILLTVLTHNAINFGVNSIINIAFTALFSFVGALLSPESKK